MPATREGLQLVSDGRGGRKWAAVVSRYADSSAVSKANTMTKPLQASTYTPGTTITVELVGRIYTCQRAMEDFIDKKSHEPVTSSNAAACVTDIEQRLVAWQTAKKVLAVFTKTNETRIEHRVTAIEQAVTRAIQTLKKIEGKSLFESKGGDAMGRTTNLSGRGRELDELMGITKPAAEIKMVGNTLLLDVVTPEQAREIIRARGR